MLAFYIVISFAMSAIMTLFWSRAPLSVSYLKRLQAMNYAEAALYEASNRIRTGYDNWDDWIRPACIAPADPTITVNGVTVTIEVWVNNMGTPADFSDDRDEIFATIDQNDVSL